MRKSIVSIVVLSAVSSSAFAANQTVNGVTQITTSQGAIAGGMQFNISANTAATVQVSYDGEGAGASVGFHGSW